MPQKSSRSLKEEHEVLVEKVCQVLRDARNVMLEPGDLSYHGNDNVNYFDDLNRLSSELKTQGYERESDIFDLVSEKVLASKEDGGLGLAKISKLCSKHEEEILFLLKAWLESLNSQDRYASTIQAPTRQKSPATRPMTLTEKILAHHAVTDTARGGLKAGDVLTIAVDWVITSEAGWFVR